MTCPRCAALVAAMEQVACDLDAPAYTSRGLHSPEAGMVLDALADWRMDGLDHAAFWRRMERAARSVRRWPAWVKGSSRNER